MNLGTVSFTGEKLIQIHLNENSCSSCIDAVYCLFYMFVTYDVIPIQIFDLVIICGKQMNTI